ncbi:protein ced-11 [Plakobranchus ocellatus]|uniref:Protein ced-11 n=1 Tax=Plakobranchus ocellatus TaxID=259542 RepID=A0AAV3YLW7_9GAST|nr:protein ced-11 [Plakobranchus ocellatus]
MYAQSVEIWKYQFFLLVQDYSERSFLPVPFVVILYPYQLIRLSYSLIQRFIRKNCPCCQYEEYEQRPEEYNISKAYLKALQKKDRMDLGKKNLAKNTELRMNQLRRGQTQIRRVISNLNDRLMELMNAQTSDCLMMEQLTATVEALRLNKMDADLPQSLHHRQCRLSPYPDTSIRRFAVLDKNVSWEELYPAYDPPIYSKPLDEYDEAIRPYVDHDVFDLMRLRDEYEKLELNSSEGMPVPEFKPEYNTVQEATGHNGETFILDRTSWIYKDDQPVPYALDLTGVPRYCSESEC